MIQIILIQLVWCDGYGHLCHHALRHAVHHSQSLRAVHSMSCHLAYFTNHWLIQNNKGNFSFKSTTHPNWTGWEQKKPLFLPCSFLSIWAWNHSWIHPDSLASGIVPPKKQSKRKKRQWRARFKLRYQWCQYQFSFAKQCAGLTNAYVGSYKLLTTKPGDTPEN